MYEVDVKFPTVCLHETPEASNTKIILFGVKAWSLYLGELIAEKHNKCTRHRKSDNSADLAHDGIGSITRRSVKSPARLPDGDR